MNVNRYKSKMFINDSDDPTYENWLVLFACIVNEKLSVSNAFQIIGLRESVEIQMTHAHYRS